MIIFNFMSATCLKGLYIFGNSGDMMDFWKTDVIPFLSVGLEQLFCSRMKGIP